MTEQEMFLHTVADLESRLASPTFYNIVRAAALVRQLLVDDHPLVHAANRHARIKLVFRPFDLRPYVPGLKWAAPVTVDASLPNTAPIKSDLFLSSKCLAIGTETYSIKDVIKHCANTRGGVHIGRADADEQRILDVDGSANIAVDYLSGADVVPVSIAVMAGIARSVLEGVQPLANELRK